MKTSWTTSLPIAISSILVPFALGSALSGWLYDLDAAGRSQDTNFTSFLLFVGTALSFTAFPVLARILADTQLLSSPVGIQVG
jgi:Kef-type K+ transport system membrane component KefB